MIYNCNICNFKCNRKVDYNRHLLTKKHNKRINNILPINSVDDDCGKKTKTVIQTMMIVIVKMNMVMTVA